MMAEASNSRGVDPLTAPTANAAGNRARRRPSMKRATSYEEWREAALAEDERSGAARWKRIDKTSLYDWQVIRRRLDELRKVKATGDPQQLLYYLNEGIHGNMGGMGSPRLYSQAKVGTKELISDYIGELADALTQLHRVPDSELSFAEKIEFFRRASHCFGRSALMLSGAGALGPFHLGVAKALVEQDLLPAVISGASAGAMVAALLGTHDRAELHRIFDPGRLPATFQEFADSGVELIRGNARIGREELVHTVNTLIPDLTFKEAEELTGLKINISVAPREVHQRSRLLNAVTSPNACIREAVLASCAIPGVFPPVTLMAKNRRGKRQPYVPSRKWVDGSVTDDLPAKRLARLYGCNHFMTSQTNPVVLWALRGTESDDSLFNRLIGIYQAAGREWMRATYPLAMEFTKGLYPLNVITRMTYGVAIQEYTADINILPRRRYWDPRKLLSVLTEAETRTLIREGEIATWPKIEMIRNCTLVSRTLDGILDDMELEYTHA